MIISSLQNSKIKEVEELRQKSARDRTQLFLIEGYREILRATDAHHPFHSLFICPELYLGTNEAALIDRVAIQGAKIYTCTEKVFRKMAYRDRPDGLLAVAPQLPLSLANLDTLFSTGTPPLIVIAESIEKPGNLGTILRSADAVGADAVIVCDRCTDIYNPNVVRASVGTLFTVKTAEASGKATLEWLKKHGVSILAATPHAHQEYTQVDLTGPVAIALGTEQLGLSDLWMQSADIQVRIPMLGVADSLNVAMSTTVLMYEVLRQRRSHGHSF